MYAQGQSGVTHVTSSREERPSGTWLAALGTVSGTQTEARVSLSPGGIPDLRGSQIAQLQLTEGRALWELNKRVVLKTELWERVWVKAYQEGVL